MREKRDTRDIWDIWDIRDKVIASHRPNRPICPSRQVKDINSKRFRHVPLVGRLEIWLVVQVGAFMGDGGTRLFLIRMEGYPPNHPPFQI